MNDSVAMVRQNESAGLKIVRVQGKRKRTPLRGPLRAKPELSMFVQPQALTLTSVPTESPTSFREVPWFREPGAKSAGDFGVDPPVLRSILVPTHG